jgi:hypothetical protein
MVQSLIQIFGLLKLNCHHMLQLWSIFSSDAPCMKNFILSLKTGCDILFAPHAGIHVIEYKWVFKLKHKPNGSIDRYSAQFVAKEFKQQYRVDYDDIFDPVLKPTTIRLLYLRPSLEVGAPAN